MKKEMEEIRHRKSEEHQQVRTKEETMLCYMK